MRGLQRNPRFVRVGLLIKQNTPLICRDRTIGPTYDMYMAWVMMWTPSRLTSHPLKKQEHLYWNGVRFWCSMPYVRWSGSVGFPNRWIPSRNHVLGRPLVIFQVAEISQTFRKRGAAAFGSLKASVGVVFRGVMRWS